MSMDSQPEENIQDRSAQEVEQEEKRRRKLLLLLLVLLLMLCCCVVFFLRYLLNPKPLPELLPAVDLNYPPHYLYSIYGVSQPVGVAISPDGKKLYVAETGNNRLLKIFEAESGKLLKEFSPPNTSSAQRSPVYLTVDASGRVYVSDRLQHAIFIYDADGNYLDTILAPNLTLSSYMESQLKGIPKGTQYFYNSFQGGPSYQLSGSKDWKTLSTPKMEPWSPLGVSISADGRLLVTNVLETNSNIIEYSASVTSAANWNKAPVPTYIFGSYGEGEGQFLFPNDALVDSKGRFFAIDGNNGRVLVWDFTHLYQNIFGRGTGESALNLPRGAFLDEKDRLFIVDAVGHNVKVFDVSGDVPQFLYAFGDLGVDDGQFNYPNDIVLFGTGSIYIADRENNRIQVWSY